MPETLSYCTVHRRQYRWPHFATAAAVCTLLLLIAAAVWTFLRPRAADRLQSLTSYGESLAGSVTLYRIEHGGNPPDFHRYPKGEQLCCWTDMQGNPVISQSQRAGGPYFSSISANPQNGLKTFAVIPGPVPPDPVLSTPAGWICFPDANRCLATDRTGLHAYAPPAPSSLRLLRAHYAGRNLLTGTIHLATNPEPADPIWFLLLPFTVPLLLNLLALRLLLRRVRATPLFVVEASAEKPSA